MNQFHLYAACIIGGALILLWMRFAGADDDAIGLFDSHSFEPVCTPDAAYDEEDYPFCSALEKLGAEQQRRADLN